MNNSLFFLTLETIIFHTILILFKMTVYYGTTWISHTTPSTENTLRELLTQNPPEIHSINQIKKHSTINREMRRL